MSNKKKIKKMLSLMLTKAIKTSVAAITTTTTTSKSSTSSTTTIGIKIKIAESLNHRIQTTESTTTSTENAALTAMVSNYIKT